MADVVGFPAGKNKKYFIKTVLFAPKGKDGIVLEPGKSYTFSDEKKRVVVLGFATYADARKYV